MRPLLIPLLAAVAWAPAAIAQEQDATPDVPDMTRDLAGGRPGAGDGPTKVWIGLYVIDIVKLDDVNQSFTADFVVRVTWHDPRLADAGASEVRAVSPTEIWDPHLTVLNKRRLWTSWPNVAHVGPQGHVMMRQRYFGELTARLDLRDFPFDDNRIGITIVSPGHGPEEIEFVVDEVSGRSETFSLVDAAVGGGETHVGAHYIAPLDASLAEFSYQFDIRRHHSYYLWKVILPLAIIVMMSWLVFWVDPTQLGPKLGLSATAVLTLIAYRFLLGNLVPRVSYLTRLDLFIVGATVLVFLGLVETVLTSHLCTAGQEGRGWMIHRLSRLAFPVAFLVLIYFSFFA